MAVLAALAPTLAEVIQTAARKAYMTVDGTLLRIDRVAMASKHDRAYYSANTRDHAGIDSIVLVQPSPSTNVGGAGQDLDARHARFV
jgi:hypothetical protein